AATGGGPAGRFDAALDDRRHAVEGQLQAGEVALHVIRTTAQTLHFHAPDNADDGRQRRFRVAAPQANALADGVLIGPMAAGELFVNDDGVQTEVVLPFLAEVARQGPS